MKSSNTFNCRSLGKYWERLSSVTNIFPESYSSAATTPHTTVWETSIRNAHLSFHFRHRWAIHWNTRRPLFHILSHVISIRQLILGKVCYWHVIVKCHNIILLHIWYKKNPEPLKHLKAPLSCCTQTYLPSTELYELL